MPETSQYQRDKQRGFVRQYFTIPSWYLPAFEVLRHAINNDIYFIDEGYEDKTSKRAACRLRKVRFFRSSPDIGTTERTFDNVAAVAKRGVKNKVKEIEDLVAERGADYGDASKNFEDIAEMTAPVEKCKHPAAKVALLMILVKVARLIVNPTHKDSWDDIAGYALCGIYVTDNARLEELN